MLSARIHKHITLDGCSNFQLQNFTLAPRDKVGKTKCTRHSTHQLLSFDPHFVENSVYFARLVIKSNDATITLFLQVYCRLRKLG